MAAPNNSKADMEDEASTRKRPLTAFAPVQDDGSCQPPHHPNTVPEQAQYSPSQPPPYDQHVAPQVQYVVDGQPITVGHNQQILVVTPFVVGEEPMQMNCKHCKEMVITRVDYTMGRFACIIVVVMLLFGCVPCACIPCCLNSCKDAMHFCPKCENYVGSYKR
ncbi:hypothetical protein L596_030266 [Steinernema carpocapsae]|uniref:LITAF domain-containing protein n=1 Tax=Steinernema carpocapsae TaxID=34508 RepID=A0A4U5LNV4_STECR|nr:hypothetical protein L596_030266 [Steinernema carpocapsae]